MTNSQIPIVEKVPVDHTDHLDFQPKSHFDRQMSIKNQPFGKKQMLDSIRKIDLFYGGEFLKRPPCDLISSPL